MFLVIALLPLLALTSVAEEAKPQTKDVKIMLSANQTCLDRKPQSPLIDCALAPFWTVPKEGLGTFELKGATDDDKYLGLQWQFDNNLLYLMVNPWMDKFELGKGGRIAFNGNFSSTCLTNLAEEEFQQNQGRRCGEGPDDPNISIKQVWEFTQEQTTT